MVLICTLHDSRSKSIKAIGLRVSVRGEDYVALRNLLAS